MIAAKPVAGWGLGVFQDVYPRYALFDVAKVVNFAHNDWLQWAAEGGLLAAIAVLLWAGWIVRRTHRQPWALGLLFVFLHAMIDYPMQRAGMAGWVFAMAGAVCAADLQDGNRRRRVRSASKTSSQTQVAEPGPGEPLGVEPVASVQ
jgi:O-antigen polymerase